MQTSVWKVIAQKPFPPTGNAGKKPSYVRKVVFDKVKNSITLTDTTDSKNVILNFITYNRPEFKGNSIQIGNASADFHGAKLLTVETLPITDRRLQTAWDHDLYRIRLKMTEPDFRLSIC